MDARLNLHEEMLLGLPNGRTLHLFAADGGRCVDIWTTHVHAFGCADTLKARYARCERYDEEWDSMQALVEVYYDGQMQDNGDTWDGYENEFKVFPCVGGLRRDARTSP